MVNPFLQERPTFTSSRSSSTCAEPPPTRTCPAGARFRTPRLCNLVPGRGTCHRDSGSTARVPSPFSENSSNSIGEAASMPSTPSNTLTSAPPPTQQNPRTSPLLKKATSLTGGSSTTGEPRCPLPRKVAPSAVVRTTAPTPRSAATASAAGMAPTAAATRATAEAQKSECPRGIETAAYRPARPRPPMAITPTDTGAGDPAAEASEAAEAVGIGRTSTRTYPATTGMRIGEMTGRRRPEEMRGRHSPGETTGAGGTNETRDGTTGIGDAGTLMIGRGIVGREVGAARRSAIEIGRGTVTGIETVRCIAGSKHASAGPVVGREGKVASLMEMGGIIWPEEYLGRLRSVHWGGGRGQGSGQAEREATCSFSIIRPVSDRTISSLGLCSRHGI